MSPRLLLLLTRSHKSMGRLDLGYAYAAMCSIGAPSRREVLGGRLS